MRSWTLHPFRFLLYALTDALPYLFFHALMDAYTTGLGLWIWFRFGFGSGVSALGSCLWLAYFMVLYLR
ncbi:hypothetical protein C8Q74DRAFT_1258500 [Fomes fomentarius]|nr:hypothetical protein C8Q74DRAFT_1258500 [Fomes fomentarius]